MQLTSASLITVAVAAGSALSLPTTTLPFVPGQTVYLSNHDDLAPLESHNDKQLIKDSYMVILKNGIDPVSFLSHQSLVSQAQLLASQSTPSTHDDDFGLRHIYDLQDHITGYSGQFTQDVLAWIRSQPEVSYVEKDTKVEVTMLQDDSSKVWDQPYDVKFHESNVNSGNIFTNQDFKTQALEKGAPWGLARVSHREELGFGTFNQYFYDTEGGEGVTAYIIDTGINIKHVEFEGRARWGKTMPQGDTDTDGNGHGTHCAGTVASKKYGVAKKAELVAVKVLGSGGSGSMSDVTGGVLWAVSDAKSLSKEFALNPTSLKAKKHKGFVANMSLGGGKSPALDQAVNGAVASGMHFGVAAGNENQDACNTSPAGASNPVTVGASTIQDERAYFSNKGKCVDIFGPGLNILSTWNTGNNSVNTISGTSMASPHVVGLLAYLLSIYGTEEFATIQGAIPMGLQTLSTSTSFGQTLSNSLFSILPIPAMVYDFFNSAVNFLTPSPSRQQLIFGSTGSSSPDIISVLHPADMKKAMIKLATPNALTDLDSDTVNKLIFNNATKYSP